MNNRFYTYHLVAKKLIESYNGNMPLAAFLKNYFAQNKKHGSTDRKQISHWCYCYYRIGKAFSYINVEEKMLIAYYLCNNFCTNYEVLYGDNWIKNWHSELNKRIIFIQQQYVGFDIINIFNEIEFVSNTIHKNEFAYSHLVQPNLFLRIRPNYKKLVEDKLMANNIFYKKLQNNCIELAPNTKVENYFELNKQVVVQDYSSQQINYFFEYIKNNSTGSMALWDCCAASGGKSILAIDVLQDVQLYVSDIRESIIANCRKRLEQAGIKKFNSFIADASKPNATKQKFDFIICDAPCTGSGTWARTPENLFYFNAASIENFYTKQIAIATNVLHQLKVNGYFLYITCSVFTKENDDVVKYLLQHHHLKLIEQKYFEGYTTQADTMFGALFQKTN